MTQSKRFLDDVYSITSDADAREYYERWAETYDAEVGGNQYQQPARCAEALKAMIEPDGATVLDVGCGSGLSGVGLRAAGFEEIDGCDFSPAMLARAERTGFYGRLFEANLNEPPIDVADEAYDAATCVGVFSFGHVMADALDDILRVIKPGGALVIGLNDHFYEEGSLTKKLEQLEAAGKLTVEKREHGDHLPGTGLQGWVISARKA